MVSQSDPLRDRKSSATESLLLSIKTWAAWLCSFPLQGIQMRLWMLRCWIFYSWKFRFSTWKIYSSNPLNIIIFMQTLIPWCRLKKSSLPALSLRFPNQIFMVSVLLITTSIPSECMHIQNNITPTTSWYSIWRPWEFFSSPPFPDRLWVSPSLPPIGCRGVFSRFKAAGAWI
jgi:hypothetical protein